MVTKYDADQLATAARAGGWRGDDVATAVAIALAESGGRMVTNDSIGETPSSRRGVERCASYGPWQINYCPGRDAGSARETAANSTDLLTHANIAYDIYAQQGWRAWTMYRNGGYRSFMQVAEDAADGLSERRTARRRTTDGDGDGDGGGLLDAARDAAVRGATVGATAINPGVGLFTWLATREGGPSTVRGAVTQIGQMALGVGLVILGLVLILREVAPEVVQLAAGAATGGGSLAAGAASAALT